MPSADGASTSGAAVFDPHSLFVVSSVYFLFMVELASARDRIADDHQSGLA
jgi:hypothetical protein